MKAIVKRIDLPTKKRTIVISDIHGSLGLLKRLLEEIRYSEADTLILLGDLIEKGNHSLATLRCIMDLSHRENVQIIMGNCDAICEDVLYELDDAGLLRYMILRKKSILNEMCEELSIKVNEEADIKYIKKQLVEHFGNELNWLAKLPHIIETKDYIFAHAGITTENLEENEAFPVIKNDAFMEKGLSFSKCLVVGHWPTTNYHKDISCHNPIIDTDCRIISIDGGNVIKKDGQLNALIINHSSTNKYEFYSVDDLPKGIITENQNGSLDSININWTDNLIEVLKEKGTECFCRHITSSHEFTISSNQIFADKNGVHCYDYTDYMLPVAKGDIVSIIERTEKQTLVKKDGIVGWVSNEKLQSCI